ncbi:MAG TPA: protein-export chaperone SecB [Bacteroidia bacterium]
MEQNKNQIQLLAITSTEIFFKRENDINANYLKAENNLEINVANNFTLLNTNGVFNVFVTINLTQTFEGKSLVQIKTTTAGTFKKSDKIEDENLLQFCNINAPAIIFPFIRETISGLSIKGGLAPIIVQPINFIELSKNKGGIVN